MSNATKIIIGIGIVLIISLLTLNTYASDRYIETVGETKNIYNVPRVEKKSAATVSTFEENGDRCYIARMSDTGGNISISISCLKADKDE